MSIQAAAVVVALPLVELVALTLATAVLLVLELLELLIVVAVAVVGRQVLQQAAQVVSSCKS